MGNGDTHCSDPESFLGVGNTLCLGENLGTEIVLVSFIIVVSLVLENVVKCIRESVKCPQMRIIVNRIFEETMILGFISMILFALGTTDALTDLHDKLTRTEQLHMKEFFHYVIFFGMMYYIIIMIMLIVIGTVIPRWLWHSPITDDPIDEEPPRLHRAMSGVVESYSAKYNRLRAQYDDRPWSFGCNLYRQFQLWKSLEVLAYHLCQDRSRPIYSTPREMAKLFGWSPESNMPLNYTTYNKLCVRNMLANITSLHWSGFIVLLGEVVLTSAFPDFDEYIFIGIGASLLLMSIVIMIKTSRILRGIVKDRLKILTQREIDNIAILRSSELSASMRCLPKPAKRLKVLATCVRAIIRMQMSALSHEALHFHDDRFWFNKPWFLLRCFQFATFGQAFYLVWFSLVQSWTIFDGNSGEIKFFIIIFIPVISLLIIMPLTMPSLVLVLGLTGFFVEQSRPPSKRGKKQTMTDIVSNKEHIRRVRRSYLRTSRADSETPTGRSISGRRSRVNSRHGSMSIRTSRRSSPGSDVFLRQYDIPSPTASEAYCRSEDSFDSDNEFEAFECDENSFDASTIGPSAMDSVPPNVFYPSPPNSPTGNFSENASPALDHSDRDSQDMGLGSFCNSFGGYPSSTGLMSTDAAQVEIDIDQGKH